MDPQPSPGPTASCARQPSQCDSHPEIRDTLVEIRTMQIAQGQDLRDTRKELRDTRRRIDRMYRHMMPRKRSGDVTVNTNAAASQGVPTAPTAALAQQTPAPSAASLEWNRVTYTLLLALAVALLAWATQGPPAGAANSRPAPAPLSTTK